MSVAITVSARKLLEQNVDAIVCSANNWLILGTGTAGEILELSGSRVQDEADAIIANNGERPVPIGTAVATSSGALAARPGRCRYIVHAVGMGYPVRHGKTADNRILATPATVASAVKSALDVVDSLRLASVAFPLMCARPGYSVLSPEDAPNIMLQTMINAIAEFGEDQKHTHVSRVILCLQDALLRARARRFLSAIANGSSMPRRT